MPKDDFDGLFWGELFDKNLSARDKILYFLLLTKGKKIKEEFQTDKNQSIEHLVFRPQQKWTWIHNRRKEMHNDWKKDIGKDTFTKRGKKRLRNHLKCVRLERAKYLNHCTVGQNHVILRHLKVTFPRAREWAKWASKRASKRSRGH